MAGFPNSTDNVVVTDGDWGAEDSAQKRRGTLCTGNTYSALVLYLFGLHGSLRSLQCAIVRLGKSDAYKPNDTMHSLFSNYCPRNSN